MSVLQHKSSELIQDKDYLNWIKELSKRFMQSQVKAAVRVNQEMLRFYWSLGKDISERKMDNKYGSHFYENLSRDLVTTLGIKKGFSPSTLKYTKYFYNLYSPLFINGQQPADDSDNPILQQPAENVIDQIIPMFKTILNCCLAFHGRTIRK